MDEIDQDTPASSASQFEERGVKRKVIITNTFPSKIRQKCDGYIKYVFFFP